MSQRRMRVDYRDASERDGRWRIKRRIGVCGPFPRTWPVGRPWVPGRGRLQLGFHTESADRRNGT